MTSRCAMLSAMSEPLVQPQFRPTLNDLVGPQWRRLPRALRIAMGVVLGALVIYLLAQRAEGDGRKALVVRGPNAFNFVYVSPLKRVAPGPGELARLSLPAGAADPQRFAVRALNLPRYSGDPGGALLLYSVALERYLKATHPGLIIRGEGRARILQTPGYQVTFQMTENGRTTFGRDIMVVPDELGARTGAVLEMVGVLSKRLPKADAIGSTSPLKLPFRSFRLGTERP